MSQKHVPITDVCPSRGVTRREALRFFIGAGLCATFYPAVANATTTQEQLDAAQLDYDEAKAELDLISDQVVEAQSALGQTQIQVSDLSIQIDTKQGEIDDKQAEIDTKQGEIDDKQAEIERKQGILAERMSAAYKAGASSTIDLLFSSATIEELTSNIYYLDKVSESDREMIDDVKRLKSELEQQKVELEQQKAALETEKAALEVQRGELQELQVQQQAQLEEVRARQAESAALVNSLSEEVKELMEKRDAELLAAQQAAEEARRQQELLQQQQQSGGTTTGGGVDVSTGSTTITGSGSLSRVVSASYSTPSPGSGLCAAWVSNVFANAGIGTFYGNADDMFYTWCGYPTSQIQPGMIVATPTVPYSAAAAIYGHVGIYVGNGTVRDNRSGVLMTTSLSEWVSMYSVSVTVRCGWLGGVALS